MHDSVDIGSFLKRHRTISSCSAVSEVSECSEEERVRSTSTDDEPLSPHLVPSDEIELLFGSPIDVPIRCSRSRFLSGSEESGSSATLTEVGDRGGDPTPGVTIRWWCCGRLGVGTRRCGIALQNHGIGLLCRIKLLWPNVILDIKPTVLMVVMMCLRKLFCINIGLKGDHRRSEATV